MEILNALKAKGFRETEHTASYSFGDFSIKLSSGYIEVLILQDKGIKNIDIRYAGSEWFDLPLWYAYLNKVEPALEGVDFDVQGKLLTDYFDLFISLFQNWTPDILLELSALAKRRAQKKYPGML